MPEFNELLDDVLPGFGEAEEKRLSRPNRKRAIGGGRQFEMSVVNQILMAVVWLRCYPTHEVLGYLFGVSDSAPTRAYCPCPCCGGFGQSAN
ncbi:MAG: transposase family protein [Chloroflexi bacterium]|nr:transposase family protein [Chloroflexota bacterium]MBP7045717.1 transposase family protein [Chloroflexota bacterium]